MWKQRYWGSSGNGTKTTTSSSSTKKALLQNDLHNQPSSSSSSSSTSAGCMCAVFHLFDFHPLTQLPNTNQSLSSPPPPQPDHHHIPKGTEAPRNSLESEEELHISPKPKQDHALHFPKGIIKIKTKSSSNGTMASNNNLSVAGNYDSPTTKTPTLVARLMGLDILPETNFSPSTTPRRNKAMAGKKGGSRSLPETPRTSCERKSSNNNYDHHRLSLQIPNNYDINKENFPNSNPSPNHYAKEIVKQMKESVLVNRKGGLNDITNYTRRDQDMIKQTKPAAKKVSSSSSPSRERQVLLFETTKKKQKKSVKEATKNKVAALKKGSNKQEESFVVSSRITKAHAIDPPLKKTPLSNQLINKHIPPFSSPTNPIQPACKRNECTDHTTDKESKQHMESSKHQQYLIHLPSNKDINNPKHHIITTTTTAANGSDNDEITAEVDYVRQILLRRSSTTSSPVYSTFFENLNYNNTLEYNISISHRKLLYHLVEELLKPHLDLIKPYRQPPAREDRWPEVVEKLCEKVKKLPRAKCEVLEDIDGIIEKDMDILGTGFEVEGEGIVKEIEECIVEELLKETVAFC